MTKILSRIKIAFCTLFYFEHFYVVSISRGELRNYLKDEDFELTINYVGLQPYNIAAISKVHADSFDETDMALMKAQFLAKVEEK